MILEQLIIILAFIGGVSVTLVVALAAVVLTWNHITPNAGLLEAIRSIRWSYAVAFFIAPVTLAGFQEGVPLLGFTVGCGFVAFIVWITWWFGPI